jgi:hypothetical protein
VIDPLRAQDRWVAVNCARLTLRRGRLLRSPGASTCFHFHSELGFRRRVVSRESSSATELRSAAAATSHANQIARAF